MTSIPTEEEISEFKENKTTIEAELLRDAGFLTRSLYRNCLRSVRQIRHGNERDEADFQEREEKRKQEEADMGSARNEEDAHLGLFSMMPAVDREDELRSRADYYHQYARENLMQETDCLPLGKGAIGVLEEYDVERFIFLLNKGEKERKWLLDDMGFPDPCKDKFPKELTQQFEERAMEHIRLNEIARGKNPASFHKGDNNNKGDGDDEELNDFFDGVEEVPQWIKDRYPHMAPPTQR